jgi:GAF domain-containing protein
MLLVVPEGRLRALASSSEAIRLLELFEEQSEEGPCPDCYRTGLPVVNQDLGSESAKLWPTFTPRAQAAGFRLVHALPMRLRGLTIGALNLFCTHEREMSESDIAVAQALAAVATIAILQHRRIAEAIVVNQQLQGALDSRVVIEQAKGTVAEREGCSMEEAFTALRIYARNHNRRLADVASGVVDGTLRLVVTSP